MLSDIDSYIAEVERLDNELGEKPLEIRNAAAIQLNKTERALHTM